MSDDRWAALIQESANGNHRPAPPRPAPPPPRRTNELNEMMDDLAIRTVSSFFLYHGNTS